MATSPASPTMDARKTSILVRFTPTSATKDQYDETIRRLEESADWLDERLQQHRLGR